MSDTRWGRIRWRRIAAWAVVFAVSGALVVATDHVAVRLVAAAMPVVALRVFIGYLPSGNERSSD